MSAPATSPLSAYQRVLLDGRARALAAGRAELVRIGGSIAQAGRDLDAIAARRGALSPLTTERAQALSADLRGVFRSLETRLAATGERNVRATVANIIDGQQEATERLLRAAGRAGVVGLAARFDRANTNAITALASRRGGVARTYQSLIRRNLADAAPAVDRLVEAGIIRGQSYRSLARAIQDYLEERLPGNEAFRLPRMGGLSSVASDARRIARTETMNALRLGNAYGGEASGIVAAYQWTLNSAHEVEDQCDDIANEDVGYGPGFYPPGDRVWAIGAHPCCGCFQGAVQLKPVSQWGADVSDEA